MLNLPTAPNLLLLPGESISAASTVIPITPASDQLTEQNFDSILAKTIENNLDKEDNSESSLSMFPAEALFTASTSTTEITGNGSLTIALSILVGNATPNTDTDRLYAENYDGPLTHISGDSLPAATKEITQQPSNILFSSQLQITRPYHANSILSTLNDSKGTAAITASEYGQDQAATQAIFSDSGKIQPLFITPSPSMHLGNALAATTPGTPSPVSASVPLTTALGSSAWPDEFGQKITWIATQRLQSAELRLHPAHLGPIEIMLQLSGEQGAQQLSAQFASHHSAVREAIEANLPRLREIMAESGIELMDTSVSADTSRQHADSDQRETSSRLAAGNGSNDSLKQREIQHIVRHEGVINTFA